MINPPAEATEVAACSSLPAAAAAAHFFLRDVKRYPHPNIYALGYPNLNRQNP